MYTQKDHTTIISKDFNEITDLAKIYECIIVNAYTKDDLSITFVFDKNRYEWQEKKSKLPYSLFNNLKFKTYSFSFSSKTKDLKIEDLEYE